MLRGLDRTAKRRGASARVRLGVRFATLAAAMVLLSACCSLGIGGDNNILGAGLGKGWNPFASKDDTPPDEPADKLYNQGVFLLNEEKNYKEAAKKFEEVDRQHPYSEWARKSLIMSAYAYYEARAYDDSVTAARRYISLH